MNCSVNFSEFLNDYLFVRIGIVGAANKDVSQTIYEVCYTFEFRANTEIFHSRVLHSACEKLVFDQLRMYFLNN